MKCLYCGSEMVLDDEDFNFAGNYNDYLICNECSSSCVLMVRYNKPFVAVWHRDSDGKENTIYYHRNN